MKRPTITFLRPFLIIAAYGLAFGIGYLTRISNPHFTLSFYISEQETYGTYQLNLKDIIDIVVIGPVFTLISFFLVYHILNDVKKREFSEKKVLISYFVFLIAIVIFNYGNIVHVTMNRLNSQIRDLYSNEPVYQAVYFLDEYIGHLLIGLGFFIVFSEATLLHTINLSKIKEEEKQNYVIKDKQQLATISLFGSLLGLISAFAYLEGQCAFVFLIMNPIMVGVLIFISRKLKINEKQNSMILLFIMMTVIFTVVVLIWGIVYGLKPVYPYFYQNSEL